MAIGMMALGCSRSGWDTRSGYRAPGRFTAFAFSLCSLFGLTTLPASAGGDDPLVEHLISFRQVAHYPESYLDSIWKANKVPQFISPVNYGVQVYRLTYWTTWHDGSPIVATGSYFLPDGKRDGLPLACYNHGSQTERDTVVRLNGEAIIPTALAADGYAAAMPDYVGLGAGERHPLYHHSGTEASATLDMLRAVRELNRLLEVTDDGHLFLGGYSQGGHAAMATHRLIEEQFPDEFPLTASAPLSGAYDMAGIQTETMFRSYDRPAYFPYLIWGMNEVYRIVPDVRMVFKPEYADTVMHMLESQAYTLEEISLILPGVPADIIRPEILEAYRNDDQSPFRKALAENSLIHWAPERPMMLCYCKADEQVDYRNSVVAYESMRSLGSTSVKLRMAGRDYGHEACALYAAIYTKMYFDSFLKGSRKGRKGPAGKRFLISLAKMGG